MAGLETQPRRLAGRGCQWLALGLEAVGRSEAISLADQVTVIGYLCGGGLLLAVGDKLHRNRLRAEDAEQMLSTQLHDLQALYDLGNRLVPLPDLNGQLTAVLRTLCELQGAQQGIVSLRRTESSDLQVEASVGFAFEGQHAQNAVSPSEGACARAFRAQRAIFIEDIEQIGTPASRAFANWHSGTASGQCIAGHS